MSENITPEALFARAVEEKREKPHMTHDSDTILEASLIAIVCLYRAAEGGNVTCREGVIQIEKLLLKNKPK